MTVAAKLQVKPGHRVAVVNAPDGIALELPEGQRGTTLNRDSLNAAMKERGVRGVRTALPQTPTANAWLDNRPAHGPCRAITH